MDIESLLLISDLTHNLSQLSYVGIFLLIYVFKDDPPALLRIMVFCWGTAIVTAFAAFEFHLFGIDLGTKLSIDFAEVLFVSGLIALLLAVMSIKSLVFALGIILVIVGYVFSAIVIFFPSGSGGPASVTYPTYFQQHRTQGITAVNDALTQSAGSSWETAKDGTCRFSDQVYYVKTPAMDHFHGCYGPQTQFRDFTYQVQMTISEGECGGLVFGDNTLHSAFYLFRVCQDRSYSLMQYTDGNGFWKDILPYRTSKEINSGAGASNLIAILTQGSDIYFYINQVQIAEIHGTLYAGGFVGLGAYSRYGDMTQVAYENVSLWVK